MIQTRLRNVSSPFPLKSSRAAYGVQGNWRAVFTGGVLESTWTAGYEGRAAPP